MNRVQEYIHGRLEEGPLHVTLIDPDRQDPERSALMVREAEKGGTHIILVGGTMGVDHPKLEDTLKAVSVATELPVIIFPASADVISGNADAILYISLMNSRNVNYVIREAARASVRIEELKIEPLSVGYIVVSPGALVGKVGDVDLIPRDDPSIAVEYALAAQMFGMDFVYLEGGSGVDEPIPGDIIQAVRSAVDIPVIVGGGIRTPGSARSTVLHGADMIVTGTLVESNADTTSSLREMIASMEEGWRERKWG
ncbi:MAG: geranylgeranylglyceryl/heptaprenylglyceryl phosphate synthase [Candidatus Thermoplasmatota archaeon]|nr:geranylgeranylglyceryl/heptaprenylglyceryl phosphate synthase [Candidatus Thermoplasmatota archaeon]